MTAPDARALLDELEKLRGEATAGRWSAGRSSGTGTAWLDADGYSIGAAGLRADAAAIVAEHNALPALTAALRGALDLADEHDGCCGPVAAQIRSTVAAALTPERTTP